MSKLPKLACAVAAMAATAGIGLAAHGAPILLKARTIVPGEDHVTPRLTSTSSTGAGVESLPERGLYIVQHDGIIQPSWRESLEAAGAIIRSYIPENAYLVEASPAVHETIRTTIPHTYLGEYKGEYRYDASTVALLASTTQTTASGAKAAVPTREFSILLFTEECREEVAAKIAKISGCSVSGADGKVIRAALTASAVREIASWPDVHWVEPFVMPTLCNNVAVQAPRMNVETVWPNGETGLGLTGKGQIVAVADTGLDTGNMNTLHAGVKGRVAKAHALGRVNDWSDPNGHGTHVVGSVLGNGEESGGASKFKGVAYEATLVFQSTLDKDGYLTGIPDDLNTLFAQAYADGARIHSNSWGSGRQDDGSIGGDDAFLGLYGNGAYVLGDYENGSYQVDEFMFGHPDMLILFAAGNDGVDWSPQDGGIDPDSIGSQPTAKNCMTVGASENLRTNGGFSCDAWSPWEKFGKDCFPNDPIASDYISRPPANSNQGIAAFSSRGPCDDGRVKPDIVAPGTDILSMRSSVGKTKWGAYNAYYQYCGGTSMACPLVAGSAALVREWLQKKRSISNPDGATIKAILLAGAKTLAPGQYGTGKYQEIPDSYPNNVEGWGQVNLGNSLQNQVGLLVYDAQIIENGDTHTFAVKAMAGNALNIVMAYTDAPGGPGSAKALVNDLDLLVVSPDGKTKTYPNSLTSADRLNNVEGVRIAGGDVVSGTYTITVNAHSIPEPMSSSLTGGKKNATRYSLVVNGATEQSPEPPVEEKPDLSFVTYGDWPAAAFLSSASSSSAKTETFEEGDSIYLFAYFRNVGKADSPGFVARHKVVNISSGSVVGSEDQGTVARAVGQGGGWNGSAVPILQGLPAGNYKWICELDVGTAVDESNEDNNRAEVSFTVTKKAVPVTGAPTSLAVSTSGENLMVSWDAVSGAESYRVYRAETSTKPSSPHATVSGSAAYLDKNVDVGKTYYYWVSAVNSEKVEGSVAGPKSGKIDVSVSLDDASTRQFDDKGGNGSVQVTANTSWNASVDKSWVHFTSSTSGGAGKTTLSFTVDATSDAADRTATITVSASGGTPKTLSISQKGVQANPALAAALDGVGLNFYSGGDSEWVEVTTEDKFSTAGTYARSGTLSKGQSGWIETRVTGTGTLQFRYSLSAISGGTFALIVDGSEVATFASLFGQWKYYSFAITSSGTHTIRWKYTQSFGSSYAMLDDISFGAGNRPRLPDTFTVESGLEGVSLSWKCADTSVSSFNVYRAQSISARSPERIATLPPGGTDRYYTLSHCDTTGTLGVDYYYWVEAVNGYGGTICNPGIGKKEGPYVRFDETELHFSAIVNPDERGRTKIGYEANIEFYAVSDVAWITFTFVPDRNFAGTIFDMDFYVEANTDSGSRHGRILLYSDADCNDMIGTLTIDQDGLLRNPTPLTWYVNASTGSDDNEGSTRETAKKTIQSAVDAALSGDAIIVEDGTYEPFSIADKMDVSIRSVNGPYRTVVQAPLTTDAEYREKGPVAYMYGRSNSIEGFYLDGRGCYSYHGGCVQGGTIKNCVVTGGYGSRGGGAYDSTLVNCLVFGNSANQCGGAYACAITNCTVFGNCTSQSEHGAVGGRSANCIVWGNTNAVGEVCNITSGTHNYCCTYPALESGVGNISQDPLLTVADGVCSLATSSPCLNAGCNDYAVGDFDLVGNPRIGNGVVDIGAVEDITVAPDVPSASIRPAATGAINLDIQATSRAMEYLIYRSTSASPRPDQPHATIKAVPNAATAYSDCDDVLPGVEYWYWVAAANDAGPSGASSAGKGYQIPSLKLSPSFLSQFAADGGYTEVGVASDSAWSAFSSKEWATAAPSAGTGSGIVAIAVERNAKTLPRDAVLSVVAGFGTAHAVTNTISITQAGAPPPVYRASFDKNGGEGSMDNLDFQEGAEQALTPCGFVRTGYSFAGWSLEPDGAAFYSDGQAVSLQNDTALYAVWAPNRYTVVFASNDGTRKTAWQEFVYGELQALRENTFVRNGGEFLGWGMTSGGPIAYRDGQLVGNLTAENDGEVVLYAIWRALPVSAPALDSLTASATAVSISIDASENAKTYRIYRSTVQVAPDAWTDEIPSDGTARQTLLDMDAEPGVDYHYWVSAVGIADNESDTKTYCGTTYRQVSLDAPERVELVSIGEEKSVPIAANSEWVIDTTNGAWITAAKATERSEDREQAVLKIGAGLTTATRDGSVTLVAGGWTQHPKTNVVSVWQIAGVVPEYGPWGDAPQVIRDNVSPTVYDAIEATFDGEAMAIGDVVALLDQNDRLRAVGKVVDSGGDPVLAVSMNVGGGTKLRGVGWRYGTAYDDVLSLSGWIVAPEPGIVEELQHWRFNHGQLQELTLDVVGWNQISFGVLPDDVSPENLFADVADKIDYVVDGNRNYLNWRPGKGGTLDAISIGTGYWVHSREKGIGWTVLGVPSPDVEIKLTAGWNMIGYPLLEERAIEDVLKTAISNKLIDETTDRIVGDGNWPKGTLRTLSPGKGYWFYVQKPCTLTFDND